MLVLLAAAALSAPAAALAASPAAATALDPAAKKAALKLARILYTEESQLRMAGRMIDETIAPALRKDENFAALELDYPGITNAMIAEMRPLLEGYVREALPDYYDRVAALLGSKLTAAEIDDLAGFYLSPTGRKLLKGVHENYRGEAMIDEVLADPDAPTSYSAMSKDHRAAVGEAVKLIDNSDTDALIALGKKPYAARLRALGPEMRKLDQDFTNAPAPEFERRVEDTLVLAMERFMAAADSRRSGKE